jgi:hypothetical protein
MPDEEVDLLETRTKKRQERKQVEEDQGTSKKPGDQWK